MASGVKLVGLAPPALEYAGGECHNSVNRAGGRDPMPSEGKKACFSRPSGKRSGWLKFLRSTWKPPLPK